MMAMERRSSELRQFRISCPRIVKRVAALTYQRVLDRLQSESTLESTQLRGLAADQKSHGLAIGSHRITLGLGPRIQCGRAHGIAAPTDPNYVVSQLTVTLTGLRGIRGCDVVRRIAMDGAHR